MPTRHCSLCASDEGLFLKITSKNRNTLLKQLEDCSLIKTAKKPNCLSSGHICHKCAYEVKLCVTFLEKVRRCDEQEKHPLKSNCILCHESLPKAYIFNLNQDKNVVANSLERFKDILDDVVRNNVAEKLQGKEGLVCLTCRYTLDILVDLKSIYQNTINKLDDKSNADIDYSTFPKVKTTVVSRKTTVRDLESLKVYVISDSDSECSSTMARGKSRHNKAANQKKSGRKKLRKCEGCQSPVKDGSDMYRFHRTGLTVCKACWTNMDPGVTITGTRKQKKLTETKSCTVFLKDVLTATTSKENRLYKVEEDSRGSKVYIITDESSEGESKPETRDSAKRKAASDTENEKVLKKNSIAATKEKSVKSADKKRKVEETVEETSVRTRQSDKKRKVDAKSSEPPKQQPQPEQQQQDNSRPLRRPAKDSTASEERTPKTLKPKSSSKPQLREPDEKNLILRSALRKRTSGARPNYSDKAQKRILKTPVKRTRSDADIANKADRKKLKTILSGVKPSRTDVSDVSTSDGESSVKGETKSVKILNTSPEDEDQPAVPDDDNNKVASDSHPAVQPEEPVAESASLSEKEATKPPKPRGAKSRRPGGEEPAFVCTECGVAYQNKLIGMTHRLTHFKQPEIRLERILPVGDDTSERERINEQAEEQSDSILMTVEDDEDDTDIEKDTTELDEARSSTNGPVDAEIDESPSHKPADTQSPASSVTEERKNTVPEENEEAVVIGTADQDQPASSRLEGESQLGEQDESSSVAVPPESSPRTKPQANHSDTDDIDNDKDLDKQKTKEPEETERGEKANSDDDDVIVEKADKERGKEPGSNENDEELVVISERVKVKVADEEEEVEEVQLLAESQRESSDQNTRLDECDEEVEEEEADIVIRIDEKDVDTTMTTVQNGQNSSKDADSANEEEKGEEDEEEESGATTVGKQENEEKEVNGKTESTRKEDEEQREQPHEDQVEGEEEEEKDKEEEGEGKTIKEKEDDKECVNDDDTRLLDTGSSPSNSVRQEDPTANDNEDAKEAESGQTEGEKGEEEHEKVGEKGREGGAAISTVGVEPLMDRSGAATGEEVRKAARGRSTEAILEGLEENDPGRMNEADVKSTSEAGDAAAVEVLQEVFELATAELQKRENAAAESTVGKVENAAEAETLENISREIQNSADASSLDSVGSQKNMEKQTNKTMPSQ